MRKGPGWERRIVSRIDQPPAPFLRTQPGMSEIWGDLARICGRVRRNARAGGLVMIRWRYSLIELGLRPGEVSAVDVPDRPIE
jgi:hypothetical protein